MPFDKKFWISFAVVLVLTMVLGFVVHGAILVPDYEALTPEVMRPAAEAEARFGFRATTPLDEGLRRTIEWYREARVTLTR